MTKVQKIKLITEFLQQRTALSQKKHPLPGDKNQPKKEDKQYSDKAKKISLAVQSGDFGCRSGDVFDLMEALIGEKLPRPEKKVHEDEVPFISSYRLLPYVCIHLEDDEDTEDAAEGILIYVSTHSDKDRAIYFDNSDGLYEYYEWAPETPPRHATPEEIANFVKSTNFKRLEEFFTPLLFECEY